ncbi:54S ribosomal protein L17 mitochondrial [Podochytrium sp. JEL0797]|nr:54S ribosomal protein L17 mitochondrial [Podochytrium sp. JEL0797]
MVSVAVLLTRNPTTLRPLSAFETSYLQYRDTLALKASNTKAFAHDHFFKKGSMLQRKWLQLHQHDTPFSSPQSPSITSNQVDDEFLAAVAQINETVARLDKKDADLKSLDRKLADSLYLVVKDNKDGKWVLPGSFGAIKSGELLHEAAKRTVEENCGTKMETWMVGKIPIGHVAKSEADKTFIMKQLILSGQVELNSKLSEHAWLTKAEMGEQMDKKYFESIQDVI